MFRVQCKFGPILRLIYSHKHKIFLPPQSSTSCNFGTPPGINVAETSEMTSSGQRSGYYIVDPGSFFITTSLAIEVEDVSLFYVAFGGDIQVVSYACTIIESVIGISWQEGSDYITITTDNMVQSDDRWHSTATCTYSLYPCINYVCIIKFCLRYFSIHWRHALLPPHVMSVLVHFLCVAGVQ